MAMPGRRVDSTVITLPSNASMKIYPQNLTSEYQVCLPRQMDLTGAQYEVGLTGFQYPRSWFNFNTKTHYSVLYTMAEAEEGQSVEWCSPLFDPNGEDDGGDDEESRTRRVVRSLYKTRRSVVPPGHYISPNEVMDLVNPSTKVGASFAYNQARRKVSLYFRPGLHGCLYKVRLTAALAEKLGWPREELTLFGRESDIIEAPRTMCLDTVDLIYVHCDMAADAHVVGDATTCLLRVIPVAGDPGQVVSYEPKRVDWFPVRMSQFRTVRVLITDGYGDRIPFESGTCSVKLLLRRTNPFVG